jgi:hypothetical protein
MSAATFEKYLTIAIAFLTIAAAPLFAQNAVSGDATNGKAVLASLAQPTYPKVALAAHISGDVDLTVEIRPDGTVASAKANNGPPLLTQPAIDSASHSHYQCQGCTSSQFSHLVYSFHFGPTIFCPEDVRSPSGNSQPPQYPQVSYSENRVVVIDRPFGTYDPITSTSTVRVRSLKCLFLWKCSSRSVS